jgi:hypothetical protein
MITASGGLVYHARAARSLFRLFNPEATWSPTRQKVSRWVHDWVELHRFKNLILIGPSAAYLMDNNVWSEVEHLVVIEPDRMAKWIFKMRFRSGTGIQLARTRKKASAWSCTWLHRSDLLPYFSRDPNEFSKFLQNYDPESTGILFFGCLGQMPFHEKDFSRKEEEARSLLLAATEPFSTASLHDLSSVTVPALSKKTAREIAELDLHLPESEYGHHVIQDLVGQLSGRLESFMEQGSEVSAIAPSEKLVWTDHDTYWLGRPSAVCPWTLTSKQIHILGFVTRP